jgi:hypothetical protein
MLSREDTLLTSCSGALRSLIEDLPETVFLGNLHFPVAAEESRLVVQTARSNGLLDSSSNLREDLHSLRFDGDSEREWQGFQAIPHSFRDSILRDYAAQRLPTAPTRARIILMPHLIIGAAHEVIETVHCPRRRGKGRSQQSAQRLPIMPAGPAPILVPQLPAIPVVSYDMRNRK